MHIDHPHPRQHYEKHNFNRKMGNSVGGICMATDSPVSMMTDKKHGPKRKQQTALSGYVRTKLDNLEKYFFPFSLHWSIFRYRVQQNDNPHKSIFTLNIF